MIKKAIRGFYGFFFVCVLFCIATYDANPMLAVSEAIIGIVSASFGKHLEKKFKVRW